VQPQDRITLLPGKYQSVAALCFSVDVCHRCTLTGKDGGYTDAAWRNEMIQNLKLVNTTCSFGWKRHVVRLKESKRLHRPFFKCESYCTSSTRNVHFELRTNEGFPVKVSFQILMHVKFVRIAVYGYLGSGRTFSCLKRAFSWLAELGTIWFQVW